MSEKKSRSTIPVFIVGFVLGAGGASMMFAKCPPTPIPAKPPAEGKAPPVAAPAKVDEPAAPAPAPMHTPVATGEVKPVASPEVKAANP